MYDVDGGWEGLVSIRVLPGRYLLHWPEEDMDGWDSNFPVQVSIWDGATNIRGPKTKRAHQKERFRSLFASQSLIQLSDFLMKPDGKPAPTITPPSPPPLLFNHAHTCNCNSEQPPKNKQEQTDIPQPPIPDIPSIPTHPYPKLLVLQLLANVLTNKACHTARYGPLAGSDTARRTSTAARSCCRGLRRWSTS
jgi:hypothetical protein